MSKIAVVTGANGWLGRSLTEFLCNGHPDNEIIKDSAYSEVRCLVLPHEDDEFLRNLSTKVTIIRGDITKADDLKPLYDSVGEIDIYHTAGIIHPKRVKQFYDINVLGAKNVLDTAPEAKVNKVVVVSSNSPIGCNPFPDHRFDETSPYNPYMNYGKSKMEMELKLTEIAKYKNLSLTFIRCPWFYGPNQPARQTLFFKMIKDGKFPLVGDGTNNRSMAYIDNLCQGIMLAGTKNSKGVSTYWIADENPYQMKDIITTVGSVLKTEFKFDVKESKLKLPWIVGEIATWIDWTIQKMGLYHQKFHVLSEMNKSIACSIDKAKKDLGYKPAVSLNEGMKRSINWCLENKMEI